MQMNENRWNPMADLEDLIYENTQMVYSDR